MIDTNNLSNEIENYRAQFNQLGKIYPPLTNVKIEHEYIADISCYWFIPQNLQSDKIILYLHGGGFITGSIESHKAMVSHLADGFNTRILFVEYALAPEKPYPSGINDVLKVYKHLLKQNSSLKVFI